MRTETSRISVSPHFLHGHHYKILEAPELGRPFDEAVRTLLRTRPQPPKTTGQSRRRKPPGRPREQALMVKHWRREYVDVGAATVRETAHGFVMVFLPPGAHGGTVRITRTLAEATALADQMAGKAASESGWWVPDRQT